MAAARELFIYYRVTLAEADALHAQVTALQQHLRALHPGLEARLLRRPEPADGWHTWMETYALPRHPDGVSMALEQEIGQLAAAMLGPLLPAARHVEVFSPCAS